MDRFRGSAPARLDEKGRLKIPNLFRQQIEEAFGRDLFVRTALGGRISIGIGFVGTLVIMVVGILYGSISGFVGVPLTLLWADDGAVDRAPEGGTVSLISRGSLKRLRDEIGIRDELDGRRFRMLFEIDGVDAHEEDEWIGREVRIGEATVTFNGDVGRCVVTSRDPDTGIVDVPTLVTLESYRPEGHSEPLPFGIYGAVARPGRVRCGDAVTWM